MSVECRVSRGTPSTRHAFTLIELLLVTAILAVITLIAVPEFVKSARGNRLRAAGRTVVASGRYARSMALIRQVPVGVTFDLVGGRLIVEEAGAPVVAEADSAAEAEPGGAPEDGTAPVTPEALATGIALDRGPPQPEVRRDRLEPVTRILDRVRVVSVEPEDEPPVTEGRHTVVYGTSGRCRPYRVTVEDEYGGALTIAVDHLAAAEVKSVGER
jgi:prepilin-type N-terminal cleavage/methylation domain-containing protein